MIKLLFPSALHRLGEEGEGGGGGGERRGIAKFPKSLKSFPRTSNKFLTFFSQS
jgi:hypothetical protein